jgi:hypothetical protein
MLFCVALCHAVCVSLTGSMVGRRYKDSGLSHTALTLVLTLSRPIPFLNPRLNRLQLLPPGEVERARAALQEQVWAEHAPAVSLCCPRPRFGCEGEDCMGGGGGPSLLSSPHPTHPKPHPLTPFLPHPPPSPSWVGALAPHTLKLVSYRPAPWP